MLGAGAEGKNYVGATVAQEDHCWDGWERGLMLYMQVDRQLQNVIHL